MSQPIKPYTPPPPLPPAPLVSPTASWRDPRAAPKPTSRHSALSPHAQRPNTGPHGATSNTALEQAFSAALASAQTEKSQPSPEQHPIPPEPVQRAPLEAKPVPASELELRFDTAEVENLLHHGLQQQPAMRGQFELLLPMGQSIGVTYDMGLGYADVMLEGRSRGLVKRLKASAASIGHTLTQRRGQPVHVVAI
jgi:hypothetical protein